MLKAGIGLGALAFGADARAQAAPQGYPRRPIDLVVVYPAGGGMDVTARILAREAERMLGHSFRVQNRAGGAGLVGHTWLAKSAAPDGYTVGVVANPNFNLDFLFRGGGFDKSDLEPIVGLNFSPITWAVRSDGPYGKGGFKALIEKAKASPNEVKIGVLPGSPFEFVTEIVEKATGTKFLHVPFQGGGPGVTALLGGNIDVTNAYYEEVEQHVKAGTLTVVAVSNDVRYDVIPDVPSMQELGVKLPHDVWGASRFAAVPPATPEPIKAYLEAEFLKVLRDPATVEAYKKVGVQVKATGRAEAKRGLENSADVLAAFLKESGARKVVARSPSR